MPNLEKYDKLIKKTLAIRILQKCKGFYTTVKFKSLEKLLNFYGDWDEIENLLYESNRQGLVMTIADHANEVIAFDQVVQVHENLINFGSKLRNVFQKVQVNRMEGGERARIFMKVKEKLDEELLEMQLRR